MSVTNACCCINGPNCWKSICAVHAGFDISELFNPPFVDKNDECKLFPFSSIFPFVAVNKLIVEGGRICSFGVGSSSDISEYAGEDEVGGGGVFLLLFESR